MRPGERRNSGIGLAELGIFLVGVAIITVAAFTQYNKRALQQKREVTIERLTAIEEALTKYAVDNGGLFPTARQGGLQGLLQAPSAKPVPTNWRGPYIESREALLDGWGVPFHYARPGGGTPPRPYDVWSFGRDGRQGGEGPDRDANSWDRKTLLP